MVRVAKSEEGPCLRVPNIRHSDFDMLSHAGNISRQEAVGFNISAWGLTRFEVKVLWCYKVQYSIN